jgi:hypothetical protein
MGEPGCSVVFGYERARAISAIIERATGHPCPGRTGGQCPLLPELPRGDDLATHEGRNAGRVPVP